jgi:hypothetical protein
MTGKTITVFRKFKEGDILALFPGEQYSRYDGSIMSYQHVGQHGAADYNGMIATTRPATPTEYEPLRKELESIGYKLDIRTRRPHNLNRRG